MNRTLRIVLSVAALLIVAGGSFFGGTLYGKSQAQAAFATRRQPGNFAGAAPDGAPRGFVQRAAGGGMLVGQIKEIGDGMMVVTDTSGKQTQVKVTDTTLIEKQASATLADLTTGEIVMVSGSTAADGSITARSVQVGAAGRFGAFGNEPPGTPAP